MKDNHIGENVTASINGEDKKASDTQAEKDDTKHSDSRDDIVVLTKPAAESKLHGKLEEISGNDSSGIGYEFLVKWVGKSNIHNSWISESELKILAKRRLENYKAKYGMSLINICKEQWCVPQRVIALRTSIDKVEEALIKWCGLPYDECTWERLDEPTVMKYVHLVTQFKFFETQSLDKDATDNFANGRNCRELSVLVDQPKELQGGMLFPHQLEALNWLRKCWYRSKMSSLLMRWVLERPCQLVLFYHPYVVSLRLIYHVLFWFLFLLCPIGCLNLHHGLLT
jgi:hypothetical protein